MENIVIGRITAQLRNALAAIHGSYIPIQTSDNYEDMLIVIKCMFKASVILRNYNEKKNSSIITSSGYGKR